MKSKRLISLLLIALFVLPVVFTACSKPKTETPEYTVTFDSNGGTYVAPVTVRMGEMINKPANPTKPYYSFDNWYLNEEFTIPFTFGTMGDKNIYLYANWLPIATVSLTFDSTGGSEVSTIYALDGTVVSVPDEPFREHHIFLGWYDGTQTNANPHNFDLPLESNVVVYAKWGLIENMLPIELYVNGIYNRTVYVEKNKKMTKPAITTLFEDSTGLILAGDTWYSNENMTVEFNFANNVTDGTNLYSTVYSDGIRFASGNNAQVASYNGTASTVIIPKNVTSIAPFAFFNNQYVKNVIIHGNITSIGEYAFYNCENLRSVGTLFAPDSLPDSVASIGQFAFSNCRSLQRISNIRVTAIQPYTFAGASLLQSVSLTENVKTIGESAFANCVSLRDIEFPQSLTTINNFAFSSSGLRTFNIPAGVTTYGRGVLEACRDLTTVSVAENNTAFNIDSAKGLYYSKDNKILHFYFGNSDVLEIASSVESISTGAFINNTTVKHIKLPAGLQNAIGALNGLHALDEITIRSFDNVPYLAAYFGARSATANATTNVFVPDTFAKVNLDGITEIPEYAFYGCRGINTYTGLNTVQKVGDYAFAYNGITEFNVPLAMTQISELAFVGCELLQNFSAASGHSKYSVIQNCIYDKTANMLLRGYIAKESYNFSDFASDFSIAPYALEFSEFGTVNLPDRITDVGAGALSGSTITNIELDFNSIVDRPGYYTRTFANLFGAPSFIDTTLYLTNEFKTITLRSRHANATVPAGAFCGVTVENVNLSDNFIALDHEAFRETMIDEFPTAKNITHIGASAFLASGLKVLNLPASVVEIGLSAFAYSEILTEVNFASNTQIKAIKESAFNSCYSLETFEFPKSINFSSLTDGAYMFAYARSLTSVTFPEGHKITLIPNGMFLQTSLQSFEMPRQVTAIGKQAFADCPLLSTFDFESGSNLTSIATEAFAGIIGPGPSFTTFTVPNYVSSIGEDAFRNCHNLTDFTFAGDMVSIIGQGAFWGCTNLKAFEFPSNVTQINTYTFTLCQSLTEITIPAAITSIGGYAFYGCTSLTDVYFEGNDGTKESKLVLISEFAFAYCIKLTTVRVPYSLQTLGTGAFSSCNVLSTFIFGDEQNGSEISAISYSSLDSNNIRIVIIYKDVRTTSDLPALGGAPLTGVTTFDFLKTVYARIYVPQQSLSIYTGTLPLQHEPWKRVQEMISPISMLP